MKRFVALVTCMLLLCATGYADVDFQLSDYTPDELAEIYSMIALELNGCIVIPSGYYVVGKDLPAGKYTILRSDELPGEDPEFAWVAVFESVAAYKGETSYWSWDTDESKAVYFANTLWSGMTVELTDGMVLAVGFGTAGIKKAPNGLFDAFWD